MQAGVLTITGDNDPKKPESDDAVTVKSGIDFTDVSVNGVRVVHLHQPDQTISFTIRFDGKAGTNSLTFIGLNPLIMIEMVNVQKLQLKSQSAVVTSPEAFDLASSTVTGTLDLSTELGPITQLGKLVVSGATTLSAAGGTDDITLTSAGNSFGTLHLNGANVTINEASTTTLGESTVESLTIKSAGAISDEAPLTVADDMTLTSVGGAITLDEASSTFGGTLTLKGTDIVVIDSDAGTELGMITAKGLLNVTSSGAVTHSEGNLSVTGVMTITAGGATPDITITEGTNNFGAVSLSGRDISIIENSATDLLATTAANLIVTSAGAITDSGAINVSGETALMAAARPITLDEPTSTFFGLITLSGTNIAVTNNTATILGDVLASGRLNLISAGDVTQPAALTSAASRVTITAADALSAYDITLGAGSQFGSISVLGRNVTLNEADASNLFTSTVMGNLSLTSGGAVTDSDDVKIEGTTFIDAGSNTITLDSLSGEFSGSVSLSGSNLTLRNVASTELGATRATRNLRVISDGAVTQSGSLTVSGRATFSTADEDITLDHPDNTFGSVAVTGHDVTLVEQDATNLYTSNVSGFLTVTSGGNITDSGILTILAGPTTLITSTANDILLDAAGSSFAGPVILVGRNIALNSSSSLNLGFVSAAGSLKMTADEDITDSNALGVVPPSPVLAAAATVIIHAEGTLTLDEIRLFTSASVTLLGDGGISV